MSKQVKLVSAFDTTEEAEAHDAWFRAKVADSLNDSRPSIAHDEAMDRISKVIEAKSPKPV